jgi:hypothetical protein
MVEMLCWELERLVLLVQARMPYPKVKTALDKILAHCLGAVALLLQHYHLLKVRRQLRLQGLRRREA